MNANSILFHVGRSMTLALICAITCSGVRAQQAWSYHFASAPFVSTPPGGAVLQPIDTITTPVTVMIPATTCPDTPTVVLSRFSANGGFAVKSFFTSTYSVEMIFQFDNLGAFKRIIDFSNSTSDGGIYTMGDCLNFYPNGNIGTCPGAFDTQNYHQLVITRDSTTQTMHVYLNGVLFSTYVDGTNTYIIHPAPNDSVKFFRDDHIVPNEASSGHVAFVRLANYELDSEQVATSFNEFCVHILSSVAEPAAQESFSVNPNPASHAVELHFTSAAEGTRDASLYDTRGVLLRQWTLQNRNSATLPLDGLPTGVYSLVITTKDGAHLVNRVVKVPD